MTLQEILNIEGIVIRKIPKQTIHDWRIYSDNVIKAYKEKGCELYISKDGVTIAREIKNNKLGGKYLITIETSSDKTVIFNRNYCGIGDTIEEAYEDFKNIKVYGDTTYGDICNFS